MSDNTSKVTGEYLLLERPDLRAWHYAHGDSVEPHEGFHDGSMAWTHCTCFGAAHRAVEPLLAEIDRLRHHLGVLATVADEFTNHASNSDGLYVITQDLASEVETGDMEPDYALGDLRAARAILPAD